MSASRELSWMCSVIDESLGPYTEPDEVVSICKEKEKKILVSLSEVMKKIQQRIQELESKAHDNVVEQPIRSEELLRASKLHSSVHRCLPQIVTKMEPYRIINAKQHLHIDNIDHTLCTMIYAIQCRKKHLINIRWKASCFADSLVSFLFSSLFQKLKLAVLLVVLLTLKSQFVQHLAVNVLSLISVFLCTTGNNWSEFIQFLCCFLEMAIARTLSCPSAPSVEVKNRNPGSSDVDFFLQYGLQNWDWSTMAGINQVLRVIFKHLKDEREDHLVKVYYDSIYSSLEKVPWHLLDAYQVSKIGDAKRSFPMNPLHINNSSAMEPEIKFLGTFLQLLSSLVDQNGIVETACDSDKKHPLLGTITDIVPIVVKWCLNKQGDCADMHILQYFKHKLLILMIRIISKTCLDCSILLSWLELLDSSFQEPLWQPFTQLQSDQDDCLEGSPFLLSISDGEACGMHSNHLQRQAIFLFLGCSLRLICQGGDSANRGKFSTSLSCLTNNPGPELDCHCRKKGLLELHKWIQGHLPAEVSINHEKYSEICINFMSSFLLLYIHEDDLLFEVLLQLLSTTSCLPQQFDKEEDEFQDVKENFPFHLSDVFNPVHLFHLFLLEIHYDHVVLLDYLISKDTGISCAKYLLRCLRLVCNSWLSFVEFSLYGESVHQSSCKKRKVLRDGTEFESDVTSSSTNNKSPTLEDNHMEDSEYGFKHVDKLPFEEATECLLSLKNSIDNLHQKNLFPYNPDVLLNRLTRFQEILEEEGIHEQKTEK